MAGGLAGRHNAQNREHVHWHGYWQDKTRVRHKQHRLAHRHMNYNGDCMKGTADCYKLHPLNNDGLIGQTDARITHRVSPRICNVQSEMCSELKNLDPGLLTLQLLATWPSQILE